VSIFKPSGITWRLGKCDQFNHSLLKPKGRLTKGRFGAHEPSMRFSTPPNAEDLVELAEDALAAIPKPLRDLLQGVAILVDDIAEEEMLRDLGIENP
jgi:hypothetical protein